MSDVTIVSMTDVTIETIESKLEHSKDADQSEALELLRSAKADLEAVDRPADDETVGSLATRIDRRLREVERRDEYSGGMGAAMNPESDEAP